MIEGKWKEVVPTIATLSNSCCAIIFDYKGNDVMRAKYAVDKGLIGTIMLICALEIKSQRSYVLRGEMEIASFR